MGVDISHHPLPLRADIDLTRDDAFLNGSTDIFDLLSSNKKSADQEALELLKAAYQKIKNAMDTIYDQNKRIEDLEALLTTDELTKLCNRRGFMQSFRGELDRAARGQSEGGLLIMIDLDNFKSINDTYGHAAGDAALRLVAEFLRCEIRDMDTAARLGGDEFIVIFPNANKEKAMKRAQILGLRMNNLSLVWGNHEIRIGASIGLKEYKAGDALEHIMAGADHGMYANKQKRKENITA